MVQKARQWLARLAILGLCSLATANEGLDPDRYVEFRINAPTMAAALIQFTQQTGLQLVYRADGTTEVAAPRVEGSFTVRAALEQLLRDSGLTFEFVNAHTILVRTRTKTPTSTHNAYAGPAVEQRQK